MRLIDADALEIALKVPMMTINGSPYIDYGFVVNRIIFAPTIAQPERMRGRWNIVTGDHHMRWRECSECSTAFDLATKWRFCPHCGADMREVNDE